MIVNFRFPLRNFLRFWSPDIPKFSAVVFYFHFSSFSAHPARQRPEEEEEGEARNILNGGVARAVSSCNRHKTGNNRKRGPWFPGRGRNNSNDQSASWFPEKGGCELRFPNYIFPILLEGCNAANLYLNIDGSRLQKGDLRCCCNKQWKQQFGRTVQWSRSMNIHGLTKSGRFRKPFYLNDNLLWSVRDKGCLWWVVGALHYMNFHLLFPFVTDIMERSQPYLSTISSGVLFLALPKGGSEIGRGMMWQ